MMRLKLSEVTANQWKYLVSVPVLVVAVVLVVFTSRMVSTTDTSIKNVAAAGTCEAGIRILVPTNTPTLSPTPTPSSTGCTVRFTISDTAYCSKTSGQLTAFAVVGSAPSGASLQLASNIVEPADKATTSGTLYTNYSSPITYGKQYPVIVTWPGIRCSGTNPTDSVVEVHFGAQVLNSSGNPFGCTASLDYYWYPWVCKACSGETVPQPINTTIREAEQVIVASDSANEDATGYAFGQSSLWIGKGKGTSYTGLRFNNVNIPQGAIIKSAKLEVQPTITAFIPMGMNIYAQLTDNSSTFNSSTKLSSTSRVLSTSYVSYSSNVNWLANRWYVLNDISKVIQEVVNRPGWKPNNSMTIIMKGTGSDYGRKDIYAPAANPSASPRLIVTYTK